MLCELQFVFYGTFPSLARRSWWRFVNAEARATCEGVANSDPSLMIWLVKVSPFEGAIWLLIGAI